MKAQRAAQIAILVVYVAGTLYVGLHHEPWRDEADKWLAARDMTLRQSIPHWTSNEGSPGLMLLLLKILTTLQLPYFSMTLLHIALAWVAAAVLIFATRYPLVTKALILASYYFAYEYAVVARSYVLTVLFAWILVAMYPERHRRPVAYAIVIALMANANVHGAIFAALLFALFAIEKPRSWAAMAIMVAGGLVAWAQMRPQPDAAFPHVIREFIPIKAWIAIGNAFFPGMTPEVAGIGALIVLALVVIAIRKRIDALVFLAGSFVLLELLYVTVWFGGYRHTGILLLATLIAIGIAREISVPAVIALDIALLAGAWFGFRMEAGDVRYAFSGSREMGTFIEANHLDRYEIAAHHFYACEAVLPYVPHKQLWYAANGRYGTYSIWDSVERIGTRMPYPVAVARAIDHFAPRGQPWLMLLNEPMPKIWAPQFRLIYATQGIVFRHEDERYWLYEYQRPTR